MSGIYPKETLEMSEMLRKHMFKDWDMESTNGWVQWYVNIGQCYPVASEGKLVGATFARLVDSEEDCREYYKDTGGEICYVEAAVSRHPMALASMFDLIWSGIGKNAKWFAFHRFKKDNAFVKVKMDRAKRNFMR